MSPTPPSVSFEFFPPASPAMAARLWSSVERLAPLGPRFVSVTYGAGGSTRARTLSAVRDIRDLTKLDVAGHLTCVGATREETLEVAREYKRSGAIGVVALRGDPPKGATSFTPHPDGFASSVELIEALAELGFAQIAVGAYPERHPEAPSADADIEHLKRKFDAGATDAITQFFFDVEDFLRFRDACARAGISGPIIPGVLPIDNFTKMRSFAARCGAKVPDQLAKRFAAVENAEAHRAVSLSVAEEMCRALLAEGAEHLHVYTLNNPDLPFELCRSLGATPAG